MCFPLYLQIQILGNIWDSPGYEAGDQVNGKLKYEHESEACSNDVPVLLVLFVRWIHVKIAWVPKIQGKKIRFYNKNDSCTYQIGSGDLLYPALSEITGGALTVHVVHILFSFVEAQDQNIYPVPWYFVCNIIGGSRIFYCFALLMNFTL